ncbi:MAG TPA: amidohydrolase family protein, partial [bacterium]|nr:amidohydrolase family protein [bacterium]
IGRQAGVPVQISHLKAAGPANWHQTEAALKLIEKARTSGLEVSYDQYPYTAASTSLTALLPPRAKEGGWSTIRQLLRDSERRKKVKEEMQQGLPGWENYSQSVGWEKIIISQVRTKKNRWLEGLTVTEICRRLKKEPVDFVLELLEEEKGAVSIIYFSMSETSVETLLRETIGFIGTDGLPSRRPHPRLWGSFTRFLGHYVREKKLMSLEQAIEKMSRLPAAKFGLKDRGELAPGRVADIVVFDPERVKDAATFQEPAKPSEGIDLVLVNGKIVLRGKHFTGATPGKLILRR